MGERRDRSAQPRGQHRQDHPAHVETTGGRGDQADADDPVADQLGELLDQRDDRHAAHGVADQDDRAFRRGRVDDRPEVAPELLDRRVLAVGAPGAAVGALVVEDRAHQVAVGRALEVPAVEVEAEAVHEDDGDVGRGAADPAEQPAGPVERVGVVDLVDLDVERYAVVGDDRDRLGAERAERDVLARTAADRPLLTRRMPTAPPAAATPSAPAREPTTRRRVLAHGSTLDRRLRCRRTSGSSGLRSWSRSRS